MWQSYRSGGKVACVKRLLQDPRVRATIDFKDGDGHTALHDASTRDSDKEETPAIVRHLATWAAVKQERLIPKKRSKEKGRKRVDLSSQS
jgi:ankyrin repeat protein